MTRRYYSPKRDTVLSMAGTITAARVMAALDSSRDAADAMLARLSRTGQLERVAVGEYRRVVGFEPVRTRELLGVLRHALEGKAAR
jgi:predicted transcriptional regulator of viral defense system